MPIRESLHLIWIMHSCSIIVLRRVGRMCMLCLFADSTVYSFVKLSVLHVVEVGGC